MTMQTLKRSTALFCLLAVTLFSGCVGVSQSKAYRGKMDISKIVSPQSLTGMKTLVVQFKGTEANPDYKRLSVAVERGLKLHVPAETELKTVVARSELRSLASIPKKIALLTIEPTSYSKPGMIDLGSDGLKFNARLVDASTKAVIGEGQFLATAQEDKVRVGGFKVSGSNAEDHNIMENSAHYIVKWLKGDD